MLKRTPIRRRPRRRPEVDWDALREKVFQRDIAAVIRHFRHDLDLVTLQGHWDGRLYIIPLNYERTEVCPAAMLDANEQFHCSGRWTLNHVEDPAKPMRGRKAPDDMDHLVSLCEHHHQGSVAGRVWAAVKENKRLQWEYLEDQRNASQETE